MLNKISKTNRVKIALIGYGKMGQEIDALCRDSRDFEIVSINYKNINDKLDLKSIAKADVAIDFTSKDVVLKNIEEVAKLGVNLVVGTTGWSGDLEIVRKIIKKYKIGLVYSPNFSVGVNIFFKIIDFSAKLLSRFPDYVVFDSNADGITLSHQAYNRVGFAKGALVAAEFIKNKKGIHAFEDLFKI